MTASSASKEGPNPPEDEADFTRHIARILDDAGLADALKKLCRLLLIESEDWKNVPAMAVLFETTAVAHLAQEIVLTGRYTRRGAIDEACRRLGVNSKTITPAPSGGLKAEGGRKEQAETRIRRLRPRGG